MKDYAVVSVSGKQYKVSVGDKIVTDNLSAQDEQISLSPVLLTKIGSDIKMGQPYLDGVSVTAKIIENKKGEKIRVFKYKAKSRYRKTRGYRHSHTVLEVLSVGGPVKDVVSETKTSREKETEPKVKKVSKKPAKKVVG
jgi:large subunit ribosomal protein L21